MDEHLSIQMEAALGELIERWKSRAALAPPAERRRIQECADELQATIKPIPNIFEETE